MNNLSAKKIIKFSSNATTGDKLRFQLEIYENNKTKSYVVRELFDEEALVAIGKIRPQNILVTTACNHYFLKKICVSEFELHKDLSAAFYEDLSNDYKLEQEKVEMKSKNNDWDLL
jgi:hypothetical protein